MRFAIAVLLTVSAILSPLIASAQSADIEAKIKEVSTDTATIILDDGESYQTPSEFNFEGLERGVRVSVFYTVIDGKRVINDLEVIDGE
ncbi:DUF1344 domain-containing protein [Pseudohoeflea coraliihabitans]|uniref:DUF1344 domain-containing protein n=1 Tax=Pseudohoeflea coraliihabitans TaxID=2860393 RepID=A0ABS6WMR1_9HYPH|nr:DUF1344 domain-containing protein [Pseudohoeflea sp. DP4N28-3]MBW3096948.1 DUF1344 domain-containing protein [Pseudohoeflea sp. DP4N28-3]